MEGRGMKGRGGKYFTQNVSIRLVLQKNIDIGFHAQLNY